TMAEYRRDDGDVVMVAAGQPRVIGNKHVPRFERFRGVFVQDVHDAAGHRVDVPRRTRDSLREHIAAWVENTGGEIAALRDRWGERRADQGDRLLFDGGDQTAPERLENQRVERVQFCRCHSSSTMRLSTSSTRADPRGPRTTVDSRSSTIAGPRNSEP